VSTGVAAAGIGHKAKMHRLNNVVTCGANVVRPAIRPGLMPTYLRNKNGPSAKETRRISADEIDVFGWFRKKRGFRPSSAGATCDLECNDATKIRCLNAGRTAKPTRGRRGVKSQTALIPEGVEGVGVATTDVAMNRFLRIEVPPPPAEPGADPPGVGAWQRGRRDRCRAGIWTQADVQRATTLAGALMGPSSIESGVRNPPSPPVATIAVNRSAETV